MRKMVLKVREGKETWIWGLLFFVLLIGESVRASIRGAVQQTSGDERP
jgi:hypothetical protein